MTVTYKHKFNKKFGYDKQASHSVQEIAKITGYRLSGLKTIYNKGMGAYYTNLHLYVNRLHHHISGLWRVLKVPSWAVKPLK